MLRAVAALMVVLHHESITLSDRLHLPVAGYDWIYGASGVDIFFVISGFVMTISSEPLIRSPHAARTFLARRLERVVPMYWLLTTLKIVLVLAHPTASLNGLGSWWHVVASYLFLPAFPPNVASGPLEPVLIVGWTLNFEMMFYALFALALATRVSIVKFMAPVLCFFVVVCVLMPTKPWPVVWYQSPLALEFLAGILLAKSVSWVRRIPVWLALPAAITAAIALLNVNAVVDVWRFLKWGLPAVVIVAAAVRLEPLLGPKAPRWFLELGDASYSVYLVHGFVLPLFAEILSHTRTDWPGVLFVSLLAMLVATGLAGDAVYRLVELPMTRWFKGRRRTAVPVNA